LVVIHYEWSSFAYFANLLMSNSFVKSPIKTTSGFG
jgi:hypothetical protein